MPSRVINFHKTVHKFILIIKTYRFFFFLVFVKYDLVLLTIWSLSAGRNHRWPYFRFDVIYQLQPEHMEMHPERWYGLRVDGPFTRGPVYSIRIAHPEPNRTENDAK